MPVGADPAALLPAPVARARDGNFALCGITRYVPRSGSHPSSDCELAGGAPATDPVCLHCSIPSLSLRALTSSARMRFRARTPAAAATVAASSTAPHPPKRRKARIAAPGEVATAPFATDVLWGVVALWGELASACRRSVFVRFFITSPRDAPPDPERRPPPRTKTTWPQPQHIRSTSYTHHTAKLASYTAEAKYDVITTLLNHAAHTTSTPLAACSRPRREVSLPPREIPTPTSPHDQGRARAYGDSDSPHPHRVRASPNLKSDT